MGCTQSHSDTSTKTASAAKKRRKISSSRAQNYAAAVDDTSIVHTEASFVTPQMPTMEINLQTRNIWPLPE
ncbi:unnamed protein product [Rotaria sordida]|uniref:Uncharacterized protein n=1 Tax=Rotaria sordida TaxID=392033 RepID=A0A815GBG0_9BILA|nr:unnamed protein product [Rotaria sordida]CAF1594498.1 unnamed protein product [Rotaria sordida]